MCTKSVLGKGSYGVVHVAVYKGDKKEEVPPVLAAKVVKISLKRHPTDQDLMFGLCDLEKELTALSLIDCERYLPSLYGYGE
jgi:predicted Ser/Thr protein kinase